MILRLKQIKTLHLKTSGTRCVTNADIIGLAKNLPELEELHLNEFDIRDNSKFELNAIGLRKMLVHAIKLKLLKLRFDDSIKIDIGDYKAMLSAVQERKEKVPLVIEIEDKGDQVDVPATILAENRKTFNVKMIRPIRLW